MSPYMAPSAPPSGQPTLFRSELWQWQKSIGCVLRNGLFLPFALLDFPVRCLFGLFGFF
jgi:hypothetical protein